MGSLVDAARSFRLELEKSVTALTRLEALRLGLTSPGVFQPSDFAGGEAPRVSSQGRGGGNFLPGTNAARNQKRREDIAAIPNSSGGPVLLGPGSFGIGPRGLSAGESAIVDELQGLRKDVNKNTNRTGGGLE